MTQCYVVSGRLQKRSGTTAILAAAKSFIVNGGEIVVYGRLWMAGCKFGTLDNALNYRRFHPGRRFSNLDLRCRAELDCQDIVLSDPRCPSDTHAIRDAAAADIYLKFAYYALDEEEWDLAEQLLDRAIGANPALIRGTPCRLADYLVANSSQFDGVDHVVVTAKGIRRVARETGLVGGTERSAIARAISYPRHPECHLGAHNRRRPSFGAGSRSWRNG